MSDKAIEISLNGKLLSIPELTLEQLVNAENPQGDAIAAALNGEFVPRRLYPQTRLKTGDQVDLVSPVGGG